MRLSRQDVVAGLWLIAITALLFLPLPVGMAARRWPALARDLIDFGHPLAFAWLAHVAFRSMRAHWPGSGWKPYAWVLAGAAAYGAATELIQGLVGRQPSLADFNNDLLGAAFALLLHGRAELRPAWRPRLALAPLATACAAVATFPLGYTLTAYLHREIRAPVLWQEGSALFAHFSRWQTEGRQALIIVEPLADWREYSQLEVDVHNKESFEHPIVVRVHDIRHDQRHEDRYNQRFTLGAMSRQTLRIPLEDIRGGPTERELEMDSIRGIVVFSVARAAEASFEVSKIRLAR